jgi:hypothetical protein
MARLNWIVLLLALAAVSVSALGGSIRAIARGGFSYFGNDGEATGTISGEIRLGKTSSSDLMFVLKDLGGVTDDGQQEAIIFLNEISRSSLIGNKLVVTGTGTFQGEPRQVEITLIDAKKRTERDQVRIRVIRGSHIEFDHSAKLDASAITISKQ